MKYEIVRSPAWATREKTIAKKKNSGFKKLFLSKYDEGCKISMMNWIMNTDNNANKKDPRTPDTVFLGLILVNFFHLNIIQVPHEP